MLHAGDYRAAINTFGAGPRELTWHMRPLINTYDAGDPPPLSAGITLAPWPNRTADGTFGHCGETFHLPINETERNNAIHGIAGEREWTVVESTDTVAELELEIDDPVQWPWPVWLRIRYELTADQGLKADVTARTNDPEATVPFGWGQHTYLCAQGAELNECTVDCTAAAYLPLDPRRKLPCGPKQSFSSPMHSSTAPVPPLCEQPMDGVWLDYAYTDLETEDDGDIHHYLWDSNGRGVELRTSANCGWAQIYTADPGHNEGYPGAGRALAIEPMSCPPDALRSGTDLAYVTADRPFEASWSISAYQR